MFETLANYIVLDLLKITAETKLATSLEFFIADAFKISLLMILVIACISFIRSWLPTDKLRSILYKTSFGVAHIFAALLGAVTPFCTCSSIPLFIGFLEARASAGVAFAFLATSPLVNEVVFVLMLGTFGWKFAFAYAISGVVLGVIAGLVIEKIYGKEIKLLESSKGNWFGGQDSFPKDFVGKVKYSFDRAITVFGKMWWVLLIGIAIGAGIHGYLPSEFFLETLGENASWWSVPLAVLLGVPIYARSSTIVPIIFALTVKGLPIGSALALMMGAAGLSLPEAIILKRIIPLKLIGIFFGIVALGIIIIGYIFNFV